MTLLYEEEISPDFDFDPESLASQVLDKSLDELGCPYESQVSLLITGPAQIKEMNQNFRGIDRETDVLSFPMNDFFVPGDFSFLEAEDVLAEAFDPESGELVLGDIVINAERVHTQAEEYGHSLRREFAFLVAHSILHLCGFDHMTPLDEQKMIKTQEAILNALGITRGDETTL